MDCFVSTFCWCSHCSSSKCYCQATFWRSGLYWISDQGRNSLIFRVQLLVLEVLLLHVCFPDSLVSTLKKFWKDLQHQFGSEMFNLVYSVQFWLLLVLIWKKVQSSRKKDSSSDTIILSGPLLQIKRVEDFWSQWLSSTLIISWKERDHSHILFSITCWKCIVVLLAQSLTTFEVLENGPKLQLGTWTYIS